MRTAILGGTFDPIHLGHLLMADEVLAGLHYEQIRFVPARVPPHKPDLPRATNEQRLRMLELAVAGRPEFVIDDYELRQDGVSYTVRTLQHLVETGTVTGKPGLIIGEDLVAGFDRWREADAVADLADIVLVRRPGQGTTQFSRPHTPIDNLLVEISSTAIRERAQDGRPIRYLLPASVYEFIRESGLYSGTKDKS